MKKRYLIAAGAYGLATAAVAVKILTRPRDVDWVKYAGELAHSEFSWFADVDGTRVHYQDAGDEDAPALILIHGFCSSTFSWTEVMLPIAAAGFRVIVPDLIGFGFTAKPSDGEYTIAAQ